MQHHFSTAKKRKYSVLFYIILVLKGDMKKINT